MAITLLIALLASVNSLVNNINAQTDSLSRLAGIGKTYLVVSHDSSSLSDSKVDSKIADIIRDVSGVENVLSQTLNKATLTTDNGSYPVTVRGVEDAKTFFKTTRAKLSGSYFENNSQANVGSILLNLASVNVNDSVTLSAGSRFTKIQIVGVVQSATQSDAEIVVPLETAFLLTEQSNSVSFVEFSLEDPTSETKVLNRIVQLLSDDCEIVKTQQVESFAQDINSQIISFLNLWSLAIYVVVVAASYVVATRLITEAKFELTMFRTLGAKRQFTIQLVFVHTIAVALLGSILGLAVGIAGAQVASTAVRWMWGNLMLSPFLDAGQALQIILLALGSAVVGCIYPAVKSARKTSMESSL
ncbi:MAG: FtsX-like permease family protein [Candidatus Bathyarchaeota archaeon]|nr:FtsX-like permease family protein [Candidatus Bathyarchaeota archaeon]